MHDLENGKRLCPFCELAYTAGDVRKTDQGDQEEHTREDGEPED